MSGVILLSECLVGNKQMVAIVSNDHGCYDNQGPTARNYKVSYSLTNAEIIVVKKRVADYAKVTSYFFLNIKRHFSTKTKLFKSV